MQKIILYYLFTPLSDPDAIKLWQRSMCENLGLKGRILIAGHGINGTLGGEEKALKAYIKETKTYAPFHDINFKWGAGGSDDFPKLSVKVRQEIVTFGVQDRIEVDKHGIVGGGKHLTPEAVHELVEKRGKDVIFFDGRNGYEAEVGRFKGAITPDVRHTRDFPEELKDPKYDEIKDKPVVTYCTGGVRCEVLSRLMKQEGFTEVYQIDGGIQAYGERYGDEGLWEGSLYVFDGRMGTAFSEKAKDIGSCSFCNGKTSNYENCANKACNDLILVCAGCTDNRLCGGCMAVAST